MIRILTIGIENLVVSFTSDLTENNYCSYRKYLRTIKTGF